MTGAALHLCARCHGSGLGGASHDGPRLICTACNGTGHQRPHDCANPSETDDPFHVRAFSPELAARQMQEIEP